VVTGDKRVGARRHLLRATVLIDVTTDTVITKEETFGPVVPHPVKTDAEEMSSSPFGC